VIDLRAWRISLLAVPIAVTVAMFSLQGVPEPRQPSIAPDAYDGAAAASLAGELAESASDPRAGSDADSELAELVRARFTALEGAEGAEQRFEVDGKELRNLIAILPGRSERQVALIAHRDVGAGTGAATSIASTAVLLEIANSFSGATHDKTLVFVSTDGGSLGAAGARRFARDYSDVDRLDAVVVLSQPAAKEPAAPLVVPWSTGPESAGIELAETANAILSEETGQPAGNEGPVQELMRLALPSGLGEQAPLIEAGVDAIRVSSSGELPPKPADDVDSNVATGSIDRFGRATLALLLALDVAPSPLEQGPEAYIGLAGNLLPGWALSLIALSLLLPVGAAAALGVGSSARSPLEAARSVAWAARRALPFLGALLVVYLLDWVGVIPDPPFPFDPRLQKLGTGGTIGVVAALAVLAGCFYLLRPLRPPSPPAAASAAPATLAVAVLGVLLVWTVNPFLALLLALGLNVWVPAATPAMPSRRAVGAVVALGLVPLAAAVGDLAGRLDAGLGVFRQLLFMVADGQIGLVLALLGCLLAGCATAIVALAGPASAPPDPEIRVLTRLARFKRPRRWSRRGPTARRRPRRGREQGSPAESPPGAEPEDEERPAEPPPEPAKDDDEAPPAEPKVDPSVYW
jgi:hypothetical protein